MRLLPVFPSMFAVRHCQLHLHHRWRRYQASTMAMQLCGPDRQKQSPKVYARLRAMDSPAFQELRLVAFDRPSHMAGRNGRSTVGVGINDANCLIQAKRGAANILPDYFPALNTVCQRGRRQGALIRTGRPGPQSPTSVDHGGALGNVTGRSPHDVLTGGRIAMFYRSGQLDQYAPNHLWRLG